jgi:hypothetical protein
MSVRELIEYISNSHSIDDVLYILGRDEEWLLWQIKDELLEYKEDFITGDEYYTEIVDE